MLVLMPQLIIYRFWSKTLIKATLGKRVFSWTLKEKTTSGLLISFIFSSKTRSYHLPLCNNLDLIKLIEFTTHVHDLNSIFKKIFFKADSIIVHWLSTWSQKKHVILFVLYCSALWLGQLFHSVRYPYLDEFHHSVSINHWIFM